MSSYNDTYTTNIYIYIYAYTINKNLDKTHYYDGLFTKLFV